MAMLSGNRIIFYSLNSTPISPSLKKRRGLKGWVIFVNLPALVHRGVLEKKKNN
jgi:hypothetical protein